MCEVREAPDLLEQHQRHGQHEHRHARRCEPELPVQFVLKTEQEVVRLPGGGELERSQDLGDRRIRYGVGGIDDALLHEELVRRGARCTSQYLVAPLEHRVEGLLRQLRVEGRLQDVLPCGAHPDVTAAVVLHVRLVPGPGVRRAVRVVDDDDVPARGHELVVRRRRAQRGVGDGRMTRAAAHQITQLGDGLAPVLLERRRGTGGRDPQDHDLLGMRLDPVRDLPRLTRDHTALAVGRVEEQPPQRSAVIAVPLPVLLAQAQIEIARAAVQLLDQGTALGARHARRQRRPLAGGADRVTGVAHPAVAGDSRCARVMTAGDHDLVHWAIADGAAQLVHPRAQRDVRGCGSGRTVRRRRRARRRRDHRHGPHRHHQRGDGQSSLHCPAARAHAHVPSVSDVRHSSTGNSRSAHPCRAESHGAPCDEGGGLITAQVRTPPEATVDRSRGSSHPYAGGVPPALPPAAPRPNCSAGMSSSLHSPLTGRVKP
ncbi:hypothetical protein GA0115256_10403 [Streptomyces sp. DconLS]|nr:hypothetical protein GA0115256_10403 [Streptomyces sp. DconLS]SCF99185.1 hypothetical protein GA0115258_12306 [Streptomyces sp. LamerLS-31b]